MRSIGKLWRVVMIKRGLLVGLILALGPSISHAASAAAVKAPVKDCFDTAVSQPELTACAASEAKDSDRRLNAAYQDIMRYLEKDEQKQLVKAQRAWIVFRDADCAFYSAGGGSIAPMNDLLCRAAHSEDRIKDLENWPPNTDRSERIPLR